VNDTERRLIGEIGALADRVRALRRTGGTSYDGGQIQALEVQSRAKWEQLRSLRAGPVNIDPPAPANRSNRR
jgi:hypothetical protein